MRIFLLCVLFLLGGATALECDSEPCQNGGNCTQGVNSYVCNCTDGYSGVRCDLGPCESTPCMYGTCYDGVNSYWCDCTPGYDGTQCETDLNECDSSPCQNGGTCSDLVNSFSCGCSSPPFSGTFCERGGGYVNRSIPFDETTVNVNIGFNFWFYDGIYSTVNVNSNGFLQFTSLSGPTYTVPTLPMTSPAKPIVAFWHE